MFSKSEEFGKWAILEGIFNSAFAVGLYLSGLEPTIFSDLGKFITEYFWLTLRTTAVQAPGDVAIYEHTVRQLEALDARRDLSDEEKADKRRKIVAIGNVKNATLSLLSVFGFTMKALGIPIADRYQKYLFSAGAIYYARMNFPKVSNWIGGHCNSLLNATADAFTPSRLDRNGLLKQ